MFLSQVGRYEFIRSFHLSFFPFYFKMFLYKRLFLKSLSLLTTRLHLVIDLNLGPCLCVIGVPFDSNTKYLVIDSLHDQPKRRVLNSENQFRVAKLKD